MSQTFKDHFEYAQQLSGVLDAALAKQRDVKFEAALGEAYFLFSFVMLDFQSKATLHADLFELLGIMLVELEDVLRGILHGQSVLSPVILATLCRVALEVRCNLRFIFSRKDPALYAGRYFKYSLAERGTFPDTTLGSAISKEEREWIVASCPEWFGADGKKKSRLTWTAEADFNSIKKVAIEVGHHQDYETVYALTSKYVHGSATLIGPYGGPDGEIGPLGQPSQCKQMAYLAVNYCMESLRDATKFFGVPLDAAAFSQWQERLAAASPELEPAFVPRPKESWE